jgi:hypothetical protein
MIHPIVDNLATHKTQKAFTFLAAQAGRGSDTRGPRMAPPAGLDPATLRLRVMQLVGLAVSSCVSLG